MKDHLKQEFIERVNASQAIVHKICSIYCDDGEQRKDLSQEILIQLWKSYPSFRGASKFSTWMYRVALNVTFQQLRKAKKQPDEVTLSPELPLTEVSGEHQERLQLLRQAISHLNEVEKAIIMLHLDEKGNDEIAQIMGITQNYVRVKMNRIKVKLKNTLNPGSDGV